MSIEAPFDNQISNQYAKPIREYHELVDALQNKNIVLDELVSALNQCLVIVDKHRQYALGEGDIAAMNARSALERAKQ